jgi:hypothetical protein
LKDSTGQWFAVTANSAGALTIDVYNHPDGTTPAQGGFALFDDDWLQDLQDVPMPDTSELEAAMKEAYVRVLFVVGDSNNNVIFDANVHNDELVQIVADNWTSRADNSETFWTVFILGAFQGRSNSDWDPGNEGAQAGETVAVSGGSLIYLEANSDAAIWYGESVPVWEQDTVVHEVGHAVAKFGGHPVTGIDGEQWAIDATSPDGIVIAHHNPSRYQPEFLARIRSTDKPYS